jgi:hypothetical protein
MLLSRESVISVEPRLLWVMTEKEAGSCGD